MKSDGRVLLGFPRLGLTCGVRGMRTGVHRQRFLRRPRKACGHRDRSQQPAEACLAGSDRIVDQRRLRPRRRSCGWQGWPRPPCGAGRSASCRKAWTGCCVTRPALRASRRSPREIAERVVALTIEPPPGETTHWTAVAMAKTVGISVSSVQRIWRAHGLQPQPIAPVQAVQRPELRGQAARCRRSLHRPAGARRGALGG